MDLLKSFNNMITNRRKLSGFLLGCIDVIAITLAFQVSYWLSYHYDGGGFFIQNKTFLGIYLGITTFWMITLYFLKISDVPRSRRYYALFFEYLYSAMLVFAMMILVYFIFKLYEVSRTFLLLVPIFGFIFLFLVRFVEYKLIRKSRSKGYNLLNVAIIADDSAEEFIDDLINQKEWGYKIYAIFSSSRKIERKYEESIISLKQSHIAILNDLMEGDIVDEVLYVKKKIESSEVRQIMRSCEELGVVFRVLDDGSDTSLNNAIKTEIYDYRFLTFINVPHNPRSLAVKSVFDVSASLILLLILLPVFIVIAIAIKVDSKGPVFFKQVRVGLRGRQFKMYKFRTMVVNAEQLLKELQAANEADGPAFKIKEDPRITKVGKFLRKTGLDEFPQLINILKGEMSFIGPRPPLPSETKQYYRWQLRRLSVKPGLSCFWQIQPNRNGIKFDKWMELDLAYIDNWSLRLDLIIFLRTAMTIFKKTGV